MRLVRKFVKEINDMNKEGLELSASVLLTSTNTDNNDDDDYCSCNRNNLFVPYVYTAHFVISPRKKIVNSLTTTTHFSLNSINKLF